VSVEATQLESVTTILADAATPIRIENYGSAEGRGSDILPMGHDGARDIAPGNQWQWYLLAWHSIAGKNIQIIQPTGMDSDENLSRPWNGARPRCFQFQNLRATVSMDDDRPHGL
jgi:hypothetical protein